ncbi:peroxidase-related enzyme [bacterium]|nr:peroxidase-related enzyme [bacterium]
MPWIQVIPETGADDSVRTAYERIAGKRGRVANVFKIQSLDLESMLAHLDLYTSLMYGKDGLTREQCELIGVAVSATNKCPYCVRHHTEALNRYWRDHNRAALFALDVKQYPLLPAERAMLDYAIKLTKTPNEMNEADVAALREVGFDDRKILLINQIASYFNYVNRLVLGLGVTIEDDTDGFAY